MPAVLYDSSIEIKHGSTVLVAVGDAMAAEPSIDGGQLVQSLEKVRAASAATIARGNQRTTLRIAICKTPEADVQPETESLFTRLIALPKTTATVTITHASGAVFQIANATVSSWASALDEGKCVVTYTIDGGALTQTVTP